MCKTFVLVHDDHDCNYNCIVIVLVIVVIRY